MLPDLTSVKQFEWKPTISTISERWTKLNQRQAKTKGTSRERQRWMVTQLLVQEAKMDQIKVTQEDTHVDEVTHKATVIGPPGQS